MNYFSHGWGMGFGWLFPLLFIGIIIYILQNNTKRKKNKPSPQDILDKRYANGEIDIKEYEEKSDTLNKK